MKFLRATMILWLLAAGSMGGCLTILWKGTEAGTGAIAKQEKPNQGPVLTGVEEGAKTTNEGMKKVDQAAKDALNKAKDAVTK
jgi:hypothetical protein